MRASGVSAALVCLCVAVASCAPAPDDAGSAAGSEASRPTATPEPAAEGRPAAGVTREGGGAADASGSGDPAAGGGDPSRVVRADRLERPEGAPTDTIVLTSRGPELAFYPDRVSAQSGSHVLIRYENGGELPHNFVLVRNEEAIDALVSAAFEAGSTDYVPVDMQDDLLAFSPLVSPGGSVDLEIVIPAPGEYTYICLFPGHAQMMLGTLRSLP